MLVASRGRPCRVVRPEQIVRRDVFKALCECRKLLGGFKVAVGVIRVFGRLVCAR